MRRKLLALLLVLVMVVSIMPLAAFAADSVNESEAVQSDTSSEEDDTEDYDVGGGNTKGNNSKSDYTEDSNTEESNTENRNPQTLFSEYSLTESNAGSDCPHENTEWKADYFEHWQICADCKDSIGMGVSQHTMSGGICTVCGYSPCDEDGHSFTGNDRSKTLGWIHRCDDCSYFDICEDYDNDCICDICGAAVHNYDMIAIDAQSHQEACRKCYAGLGEVEPHTDSDDNGVCDECNYRIRECTHENDVDCLFDNKVHELFCLDCETFFTREEHTMCDSVCTVCGYVPCEEHSYDFSMNTYGGHWCLNCWTITSNCEDADHDCVCDICGWENHPNSTYEITKNYHCNRFCSDCGRVVSSIEGLHYDEDEDGKCDACGYQMVQIDVIDPVPEEPDPEVKPGQEEQPAPTESTEPEDEILPDTSEDPELVGKPSNTNGAAQPAEAAKTVLQAYQPLYKKNSDMFGWVTIAGTKIDYPVMHTPGNPEKYLDLNFEKENSDAGTPFINAECDFDSDNVIIYAKNMEDGSMFHGLLAYQDEAFWRENPVISFNTIYEEHEYEILAAFYTEEYVEGSTDFQIDDFVNADNEEEFDETISYIREKAIYNTGVEVNYGDKLVTLITETPDNGRFVVVARRK